MVLWWVQRWPASSAYSSDIFVSATGIFKTCTCFRNMDFCRFWYEGNSPEVRFTPEQLRQVCKILDAVKYVNLSYRCRGSLYRPCCVATRTAWRPCLDARWTLKAERTLLSPVLICLCGTIKHGVNRVILQWLFKCNY